MSDYTEHYNDHYKRYGKLGSGTGEREVKNALWESLGVTGRILDYGCGWGAMLPQDNYVGVDISDEAIRLGKIEFPDADLRVMEMGKLDLGEKFDFIAAQSVFTHVPKENVAECLDDIKRHLKPKGFALIDVLHENSLDTLHLTYWQKHKWLEALAESGFMASHAKTINWRGYVHDYYVCRHSP